jgi:DNA mismatch endonuclease, patch repair protein
MTDVFSQEKRSQVMRNIKSRDTKPELMVRKLVHSLGFRYRLSDPKLPGRPDLTFKSRKKVIFVHGCFWHQHDSPDCRVGRIPKSRQDYWIPKLRKNVLRDQENKSALISNEWGVLEIWECETKSRNREKLISTITDFLGAISE